MTDLYYDPDTKDAERWIAMCERFEESPDFDMAAWDAFTGQGHPPAEFTGLVAEWFRNSPHFKQAVDDHFEQLEYDARLRVVQ